MQKIIHGDCLEEMRKMADNSIDCIVTDPPYGISFMGKKWDGRIPSIEYWREALRVCKPGAYLLAFGGSRTHHHLMCGIEGGGWEIRDVIMWLYGSGFPKSHNFGKKLGGKWDGFGTTLKPAYEPIIMAMKPCDGTFAQNAEKWDVAGINIDKSRILVIPNDKNHRHNPSCGNNGENSVFGCGGHNGNLSNKGRWPANIILDEEAGEMLNEQSGKTMSKSGGMRGENSGMWKGKKNMSRGGHNDSGGASRFFYCAKASPSERNAGLEDMPLKIGVGMNATVCGDTRTGKITTQQNNHPTVKPVKLMQYLLKLVMPPNPEAILLDPFAGSGTTILAAKQLGFNAIGIEKENEYVEIANNRINTIQK
jgi:DNA modification methylase